MYNVYENYIPGSSEKPKDTYDYSYDTGYEVIDVTKPMYITIGLLLMKVQISQNFMEKYLTFLMSIRMA